MAGRKWVDVIPGLWSLGADYHFSGKVSIEESDPEMVFLKCLKYYWTENDVYFMLFNLLTLRIGPLIHVERLIKLAQTGFLGNDEMILLIVTADRLAQQGDHRFKNVRKKLYKKGMKLRELPARHGQPEFVKTHGTEEGFLEFGAKVRKFLEPKDKKLSSIKRIFKRNGWLKMRALMGPNYRADVFYLISSGQAKTAAAAARMTSCDYSATYRLLKYSKEFDNLESILGVS